MLVALEAWEMSGEKERPRPLHNLIELEKFMRETFVEEDGRNFSLPNESAERAFMEILNE